MNVDPGLNCIRNKKTHGKGETKKARMWCKVYIRMSVEKSAGVHLVLYRFRFLVRLKLY